jgi:hypothetical protein
MPGNRLIIFPPSLTLPHPGGGNQPSHLRKVYLGHNTRSTTRPLSRFSQGQGLTIPSYMPSESFPWATGAAVARAGNSGSARQTNSPAAAVTP